MNTQPARGMRDFLPADVRRREYVVGVIKEVYERYGFEPLETPAVENIETLLGKYGEEGNQLIYKILKRGEHEKSGEADLALRYDLTVPLARVVAQYKNELPKFFKRYQIQPVWRADRPARGRYREFYQCDVDILGSRSMVVEAELCSAVSDVLAELEFNNFTIRLNHREVLAGILYASGISVEKHNDALIVFDKLDKIGEEGVKEELRRRGIVTTEEMLELLFLQFKYKSLAEIAAQTENGSDTTIYNNTLLDMLRAPIGNYQPGQDGLLELTKIIQFTSATSAGSHIKIDTSLARGLSYYTGAIMEINVPDLAGSLGGGGRYDNLVGMFSGQDVPACGFSLGLERIIVVMNEKGMFRPELQGNQIQPADVMVTIWDEESIPYALELAAELRTKELSVLFYPEVRKPAKQLFYADSRKIPFAIIVGLNERENGKFRVRRLHAGGEEELSREEIAKYINDQKNAQEAKRHELRNIMERRIKEGNKES